MSMRCDRQDLNEGDRYWSHGRLWLRPANWCKPDGRALAIEWHTPTRGLWVWGATFGGGDGGSDLSCSITVPGFLTVYLTLDNLFGRRLFAYDFDQGEDREVEITLSRNKAVGGGWTVRYALWVGSMASWSRTAAWCRWWRQGSLDFLDLLLGRCRCETEKSVPVPCVVPMPEGQYNATATQESRVWRRRFGLVWHRRQSWWLEIPKGIPHAGKGENSWDCGDDGLFGIGGDTMEDAIGNAVASVLRDRRRYGHASPEAIAQALS